MRAASSLFRNTITCFGYTTDQMHQHMQNCCTIPRCSSLYSARAHDPPIMQTALSELLQLDYQSYIASLIFILEKNTKNLFPKPLVIENSSRIIC